jgi:hypothetical protein
LEPSAIKVSLDFGAEKVGGRLSSLTAQDNDKRAKAEVESGLRREC